MIRPAHHPAVQAPLLRERERRRLSFEVRTPLWFDFSWPTHTAHSELRGLGVTRIHTPHCGQTQYKIDAVFITSVRPEGESAVTLSIRTDPDAGEPLVAAESLLSRPLEDDPLLAALLGRHPLDWMRSLLHGVGSRAWAHIARATSVWPAGLDRILLVWRELSCGAEAALWRCAGDPHGFDSIVRWADFFESESHTAELEAAVRSSLLSGPLWPSSPAAEWLEGSAGMPLPLIDAPAAAHRLRLAAGLVRRLVNAGLSAEVLRSLRELAESAPAETSICPPLAVAGSQRRRHEPALRSLCRDIYAEAQALAGARCAARFGLAAQSNWPLAEATFDLASGEAIARFHRALAGDLTAFLPAPGVRTSPSLHLFLASAPLALRVRLPLFAHRKSHRAIASLAGAQMLTAGGGVDVRMPAGGSDGLAESSLSLLEHAVLSPFRAASREPGGCEDPLSFEHSFHLSRCTPNCHLDSLLEWLGVPKPPETLGFDAVRLRISVPLAWAEVWHELPHSRDDAFAAVFSSISASVHEAMRRWIPALALQHRAAYEEPYLVLPLLAYAASAPFPANSKQHLSRGALSAFAVRQALSSAAPTFHSRLQSVYSCLQETGHRSWRSYHPGRSNTLLGNVYRQRAAIARLLSADVFFTEETLHMADLAKELRANAAAATQASKILFRAFESSRNALERCYRRILDAPAMRALPAILWIEATAAACRAMGAEAHVASSAAFQSGGAAVYSHNPTALGLR